LKVSTLSHIRKENPYRINPVIIYGLIATLRILAIIFVVSAEIPPVLTTPVFRRMLAVTLKATLTTSRA